MSKRWTEREDLFLLEYLDDIGPEIIHMADMPNRSVASIKARAKKLKESGAWRHYQLAMQHKHQARKLAGHISKSELGQMMAADYEKPLARRAVDTANLIVGSF